MPSYYPISRVIGKKITYFLKMKGISLIKLAKVIGVSEQQQSRYEHGINGINLDKLNLYVKYFNINLYEFFSLNEDDVFEVNNIIIFNMTK